MLTRRERDKLLEELAKHAPEMSDDDLIDAVGFVKDSARDNPRQDASLKLVYPEPLVARR